MIGDEMRSGLDDGFLYGSRACKSEERKKADLNKKILYTNITLQFNDMFCS